MRTIQTNEDKFDIKHPDEILLLFGKQSSLSYDFFEKRLMRLFTIENISVSVVLTL